jgi:hypothetical protein
LEKDLEHPTETMIINKNKIKLEDKENDLKFHNFNFNTIKKIMEPYIDLKFISIGSGRGRLEKKLVENNFDIICIDPEPNSFEDGKIFLKPKYDYYTNFMKDHNKEDKLGIMLIWTHGSTTFDYESIQDLKPTTIVVLYEKYELLGIPANGAAGSPKFHQWTRDKNNGYELVTQVRISVKNFDITNYYLEIYEIK